MNKLVHIWIDRKLANNWIVTNLITINNFRLCLSIFGTHETICNYFNEKKGIFYEKIQIKSEKPIFWAQNMVGNFKENKTNLNTNCWNWNVSKANESRRKSYFVFAELVKIHRYGHWSWNEFDLVWLIAWSKSVDKMQTLLIQLSFLCVFYWSAVPQHCLVLPGRCVRFISKSHPILKGHKIFRCKGVHQKMLPKKLESLKNVTEFKSRSMKEKPDIFD